MTSKTTNKFPPELRARAMRPVSDHEADPLAEAEARYYAMLDQHQIAALLKPNGLR